MDRDVDDICRICDEAERHDDPGDVLTWVTGEYGRRPPEEQSRIETEIARQPVYRGTLFRGEFGTNGPPQEGSTHSWGRHVSASKRRRVPAEEGFIDPEDPSSILWQLEDAEGHDISQHPETLDEGYEGQHEVVIPANHRFHVQSVNWRGRGAPGIGDGHWHVVARRLPETDRHAASNPYEDFEAAVWHPKHGIHVGGTHPYVIMQAMKKGVDLSDDDRAVDGFYDHANGRFLTREQVGQGGAAVPESMTMDTKGALDASDAVDDALSDGSLDVEEMLDRQIRLLKQGGAKMRRDDPTNITRWRAPKHQIGGPDWNSAITRHALTGQSAVCDKRVARPKADPDLDDVCAIMESAGSLARRHS